MPNYNVIPLKSEPGIQRDGTKFNTKAHIDGQWVRWYLGEPRKIGGYRIIDNGNQEIARSLYTVEKNGVISQNIDVYQGRASSLTFTTFDEQSSVINSGDRTPTNYISDYYDANNLWSFDLYTNKTNPLDNLIVAHVAPNASNALNPNEGPIYFGDTIGPSETAPLTQIVDADSNPILASGGIVYSAPICVAYGNNGVIQWSAEGSIQNWPTDNNQVITNKKILKMIRARGSQTPQFLAWTSSSLLNVAYVSGSGGASFSSVTIADDITLMSAASIVQYEQEIFWIGTNDFFYHNGIVNSLDNDMNKEYFFSNLNYSQKSKVFGIIIPEFKEVWWFWPKGNATECTNVLIYNFHPKIRRWYDLTLSRASAVYSGLFEKPIMADNELLPITTRIGPLEVYPLWEHEYGYDKIINDSDISSIPSFYETRIVTLFENNPQLNRLMRTRRIEPNFLQNGRMSVTINNRGFASDTLANGRLLQSGPYYFNQNTQKIDDVDSQGRLVSFVFSSNEIGGAYQAGNILLDFDVGDVSPP